MLSTELDINPLTPFMGAEINGVDLRRSDQVLIGQIQKVLQQYSVVFFRDQPALSPAEHSALANAFGPIHVHPAAPQGSEFPGVLKIEARRDTKVAAGNRWHSDVSCEQEPPYVSILQLHEIPPVGGDTLFASMYAAYEALSPRMKQMLDGMTARHSGEWSYRHLFKYQPHEPADGYPEAVHPVVIRPSGSDRPALYVNREFTVELEDLPQAEGQALLEFLFDHAERADFQCRFRWSSDAIAIWDNRSTQHFAMWDYWPHSRKGRRVSVRGPRPQMWYLEEASTA
ncbi:MAG TPA: taurine dioxygenase [Gammaproteobacteria bacterium]|nr:taurine dioxygenase [Gammaproteobacteria bacterium]